MDQLTGNYASFREELDALALQFSIELQVARNNEFFNILPKDLPWEQRDPVTVPPDDGLLPKTSIEEYVAPFREYELEGPRKLRDLVKSREIVDNKLEADESFVLGAIFHDIDEAIPVATWKSYVADDLRSYMSDLKGSVGGQRMILGIFERIAESQYRIVDKMQKNAVSIVQAGIDSLKGNSVSADDLVTLTGTTLSLVSGLKGGVGAAGIASGVISLLESLPGGDGSSNQNLSSVDADTPDEIRGWVANQLVELKEDLQQEQRNIRGTLRKIQEMIYNSDGGAAVSILPPRIVSPGVADEFKKENIPYPDIPSTPDRRGPERQGY